MEENDGEDYYQFVKKNIKEKTIEKNNNIDNDQIDFDNWIKNFNFEFF